MPSVRLVANINKACEQPKRNGSPTSVKENVEHRRTCPSQLDFSTNIINSPSNTPAMKTCVTHPMNENSKKLKQRHRSPSEMAKVTSDTVTSGKETGMKRSAEDAQHSRKSTSDSKQKRTRTESAHPPIEYTEDKKERDMREKFSGEGFSKSEIDRILYYMKEEKARMEIDIKEEKARIETDTKKKAATEEEKETNKKRRVETYDTQYSKAKESYESERRRYEKAKHDYEMAKYMSQNYEERSREVRKHAQDLINEYNRLRMKHKMALKQEDYYNQNLKQAKQQSEKSKAIYDQLGGLKSTSANADRNGKGGNHQQIQININSSHYNHVEFHTTTPPKAKREKRKGSSPKYRTQNH